MAQDSGDPVIASGSNGSDAMKATNAALKAARSNHSGSGEPTSPVPYQFWLDTDADGLKVLKQRDAADTDWNWLWSLESGAGCPYNGLAQSVDDGDYNMPTLISGGSEKAAQIQVFDVIASSADRTITLRSPSDFLYGRILLVRPYFDDPDYDVIVTGSSLPGAPSGGFRLAPGDVLELYAFGSSPAWSVVRFESRGVITVTAAKTLSFWERTVFLDSSGGAFTLTLPAAADAKGVPFLLKKIDSSANAITVSPNADGASQSLSAQYDALALMSDGSNYYKLPA